MKKRLFIFLCTFLLQSCTHGVKSFKAGKLTTVYDDSCGELLYHGVRILACTGNYYVLDKDDFSVKVFDDKFSLQKVIQIKKGQGPHEMQTITSMDISKETGMIYLAGGFELMRMKSDGTFVNKTNVDLPLLYDFKVYRDRFLFTVNLGTSYGTGFPFNLKAFFVELDLLKKTRTTFGSMENVDFSRLEEDVLAGFNYYNIICGKLVIVNPFIKQIYAFDLTTLRLRKTVELGLDDQHEMLTRMVADLYGNAYMCSYNRGSRNLDVYCFDDSLDLMGVQKVEGKLWPEDLLITPDLKMLMLTHQGEKLQLCQLNPQILFLKGDTPAFIDYLRYCLIDSGYNIQSTAQHYLDQYEVFDLKSDLLTSEYSSLRIFHFGPEKIIFAAGRRSASIFEYERTSNKFRLITNQSFQNGYFSFQSDGDHVTVLENGNTRDKMRHIYYLDHHGTLIREQKVGIHFVIDYYNAQTKDIILEKQKNFYFFHDSRPILLVSVSDLLQRGLGMGKYVDVKVQCVDHGYYLLFPSDNYYLKIDPKKGIMKEGQLVSAAMMKHGEILDCTALKTGNVLSVISKKDFGIRRLVVVENEKDAQSFKLCLDLPLPEPFGCNLNKKGEILLNFKGETDFLFLICPIKPSVKGASL